MKLTQMLPFSIIATVFLAGCGGSNSMQVNVGPAQILIPNAYEPQTIGLLDQDFNNRELSSIFIKESEALDSHIIIGSRTNVGSGSISNQLLSVGKILHGYEYQDNTSSLIECTNGNKFSIATHQFVRQSNSSTDQGVTSQYYVQSILSLSQSEKNEDKQFIISALTFSENEANKLHQAITSITC